jgi:hypothetical protein
MQHIRSLVLTPKQTTIKKEPTQWSRTQQLSLLKEIETKLGIKEPSDWYKYHKSHLSRNGGRKLLRLHKSIPTLLLTLYPDYPWDTSKYCAYDFVYLISHNSPRFSSRSHWVDPSTHYIWLKTIENKLNIKQPSDWYKHTYSDVANQGGLSVLAKYYNSSIFKMLKTLYPDYHWDVHRYHIKRIQIMINVLVSSKCLGDIG